MSVNFHNLGRTEQTLSMSNTCCAFLTLQSTHNRDSVRFVRRVEVDARNTPDGKGSAVFGDIDDLSKIMIVLAAANTDPTSRCDCKVGFLDREQGRSFVNRNEVYSSRKVHAYETCTGLLYVLRIARFNVDHAWKTVTLKSRDYFEGICGLF